MALQFNNSLITIYSSFFEVKDEVKDSWLNYRASGIMHFFPANCAIFFKFFILFTYISPQILK